MCFVCVYVCEVYIYIYSLIVCLFVLLFLIFQFRVDCISFIYSFIDFQANLIRLQLQEITIARYECLSIHGLIVQ